jgi:hypothetical protein
MRLTDTVNEEIDGFTMRAAMPGSRITAAR